MLAIAFLILTVSNIQSAQPPTGTITGGVYQEGTIIPEPTITETPIPTESPTPEPTVTVTATATPTPTPTPEPENETTIAYLGDSRPSKFGNVGITELTKDLNQVIPQSPTGRIDAIMMIGDMDHVSQTVQAYQASNVHNVPVYFVVGNHEIDNGDMNYLKGLTLPSNFNITRGPTGTEKTTYSIDIRKIHVTNINEYWNEAGNDAWFKYGSREGGFIGPKLMTWIDTDLSNTTKWKVVLGHEPLYPKTRHVGDSLDKDTVNRNALQNLFISKNVSVFVGAHTHYTTINKYGSVYHADGGISGQKTVDGEDPYASIHTTPNSLILTWKHENPTWSTPKIISYTI